MACLSGYARRVTSTVASLAGVPVLVCASQGPALDEQGVLDLIGDAMHHGVEWVAVPVSRCPEEFFSLRSGVLGAVTQKFVNYQLRLALVGDVSDHVARSNALRDFVRETNQGRQVWFVETREALAERLSRQREQTAPVS